MTAEPSDNDLIDFLDDTGWKPPTRKRCASKLVQWERWLSEHRGVAPRDARRTDLRKYLAEREAAGIAASTRHKDWQVVRAFYTWASRSHRDGGGGLIDRDEMEGVDPPSIPKLPTTRAAKPSEVEAIEDHFVRLSRQRRKGGESERARRNLLAVSLMFRSGARTGELVGVDLADVVERDDGRFVIVLRAEITKSGEPRVLPVHPTTVRYLDRYLRVRGRAPGPLLLGREAHTVSRDGRLTAEALGQCISRAAKRCGVPVSAHQLRRGWTSAVIRSGLNATVVEVVGGWSDHRMPRRYMADEAQQVAVDTYFDSLGPAPKRPRGHLRTVRAS